MNYLVYDLEIENAVPISTEEKIPGIIYCKGWNDKKNMGLACIGVYDSQLDKYAIFQKTFRMADLLKRISSLKAPF